MKKLFRIAAVIFMFTFVFLGAVACGDPYSKVRISLSSSVDMVSNSIVFDRNEDISLNTFTITSKISGLPKTAQSSETLLRIEKPSIVRKISEETNGSETTFTFEASYSGTSRIYFTAEGGKEEVCTVTVNEEVRSVKVNASYRPALIRGGKGLEFDETKVIYNNIDTNPLAVDASFNLKGIDITLAPGQSSSGVVISSSNVISVNKISLATQVVLRINAKNPGSANVAPYSITLPIVDEIETNAGETVLSGGGTLVQAEVSQGVAYGGITMFSNADNTNRHAQISLSRSLTNHNGREDEIEFSFAEFESSNSNAKEVEKSIYTFNFIQSTTGTTVKTTNALLEIECSNFTGTSAIKIYAQIKGQSHTKVLFALIDLATIARPSRLLMEVDGKSFSENTNADVFKNTKTNFSLSVQPSYVEPLSLDGEFEFILVFKAGALNIRQYLEIKNADGSEVFDDYSEIGIIKTRVKPNFTINVLNEPYITASTLKDYVNSEISVYAIERTQSTTFQYLNSVFSFKVSPKIGVEDVSFLSGVENVEETEENKVAHVVIDKAAVQSHTVVFSTSPSNVSEDAIVFEYADYSMRAIASFEADGNKIVITPYVAESEIEIVAFSKSLRKNISIVVKIISLPQPDETVMPKIENTPVANENIRLVIGKELEIGATVVKNGKISSTQTTFTADSPLYSGEKISATANGKTFKIYALASGVTELTLNFKDQAGTVHSVILSIQTYKEVLEENIVITKNGEAYIENDVIYGRQNTSDRDSATSYFVSLLNFSAEDYVLNNVSFSYKITSGFELLSSPLLQENKTNSLQVAPKIGNISEVRNVEIVFYVYAGNECIATKTLAVKIVPKVLASDINLNLNSLYFWANGQTATIEASIANSNATVNKIYFESLNVGVATVSSTGVVTARGAGEAQIAITSYDGNVVKYVTVVVADGSLLNPYLITTVSELKAVNGTTANYKLLNNINLLGQQWSPISFTGNFDGNNKIIYNFSLNYNVVSNNENVGLFGTVTGSVINLEVKHRAITISQGAGVTSYNFGVIAGVITNTALTAGLKVSADKGYEIISPLTVIVAGEEVKLIASNLVSCIGSTIVTKLNGAEIGAQEGTSSSTTATSAQINVLNNIVIYENTSISLNNVLTYTIYSGATPIASPFCVFESSTTAVSINSSFINIMQDGFYGDVTFTVTYLNGNVSDSVTIYFAKKTFNLNSEREVTLERASDYVINKTAVEAPFKTEIVRIGDNYFENVYIVSSTYGKAVVFTSEIIINAYDTVKNFTVSIISGNENKIDITESLIIKINLVSTASGDEPNMLNWGTTALGYEVYKIGSDANGNFYYMVNPKKTGFFELSFYSTKVAGASPIKIGYYVYNSNEARVSTFLINDNIENLNDYLIKKHDAGTSIYTIMNKSDNRIPVPNNLVIEIAEPDSDYLKNFLQIETIKILPNIKTTGNVPMPAIGTGSYIKTVSGANSSYFLIPITLDYYKLDSTGKEYIVPFGQAYTFIIEISFANSSAKIEREVTFTAKYPLSLEASFAGTTSIAKNVIRGNEFEIETTISNFVDINNVQFYYEIPANVNAQFVKKENSVHTFRLDSTQLSEFKINIYAIETVESGTVRSNFTAPLTVRPVLFELNGIYIEDKKGNPYSDIYTQTNKHPASSVAEFKIKANTTTGVEDASEEIAQLESDLNRNIHNILKYSAGSSGLNDVLQSNNSYFNVLDDDSGQPSKEPVKIEFLVINTQIRFEIEPQIGIINSVYTYTTGQFGNVFPFKMDLLIEQGTNDDNPYPIESAERLRNFLTIDGVSAESDVENARLILLSDIVIGADWFSGVKTIEANFASLDGNGFVISLSDGAFNSIASSINPEDVYDEENPLNIGLFTSIGANTIIKNVTIGIAERRPLTGDNASGNPRSGLFSFVADVSFVNSATKPVVNFGLLAGVNNGTVTNAKVLSVKENSLKRLVESNLTADVVLMPFISGASGTASCVFNAGLITGTNNGFITNSNAQTNLTVGGKFNNLEGYNTMTHLNLVAESESTGDFIVGGFAAVNNKKISSSFFKNANINNLAKDNTNAVTGGFVAMNYGDINYSYIEGESATSIISSDEGEDEYLRKTSNSISANTIIGGFVYQNSGYIGNCYSNIKLETGSLNAGFVQYNRTVEGPEKTALIEFSFSLSDIANYYYAGSKAFYGGEISESMETGIINNCMYLEFLSTSKPYNQIDRGVSKIEFKDFQDSGKFNGFAFGSSEEGAIWEMKSFTAGNNSLNIPKLVSADFVINPSRKLVREETQADGSIKYYYLDLTDIGTAQNPILISKTEDFELIYLTAQANNAKINTEHYRFIKDIEFPRGQSVASQEVVMSGQIDGNAMEISNIYINGGNQERQGINSIGLFGALAGEIKQVNNTSVVTPAVIKGLRLSINNFYGAQIEFAGALVGKATNANIFDITVSSPNDCIVWGKNIVGGVVGLVEGQSLIYNIKSSVDVISTHKHNSRADVLLGGQGTTANRFEIFGSNKTNSYENMSYAGGAIGAINVSEMGSRFISNAVYATGCQVEGGYAGGVVGFIGENSYVADYKYIATSKSTLNGRIAAGGVVGENRGVAIFFTSEFEESVQKQIDVIGGSGYGSLDAAGQNQKVFGSMEAFAAGGIAGLNFGGTIKHGYSKLPINNTRVDTAGGIAGISIAGTFDYLYASASVTAKRYAGGIIGYLHSVTGRETEKINGEDVRINPPQRLIAPVTISNTFALNGYNDKARESGGADVKGGVFGYIKERNEAAEEGGAIEPVLNYNNSFDNYYRNSTSAIGDALPQILEIFGLSGSAYPEMATSFTAISNDEMENTILKNLVSNTWPGAGEPGTKFSILFAFYNSINWQDFYTAKTDFERFPKLVNYQNPYINSYEISTKDDLIKYSAEEYRNSHLIITTDDIIITESDLTNLKFENFGGVLESDAGLRTIKIQASRPLFNQLSGAIIRNINFEIIKAAGLSETNLGGVARQAVSTRFENCNVEYTATAANNAEIDYAGGYIGLSLGSNIFEDSTISKFSLNITANKNANIGGYVGESMHDIFRQGASGTNAQNIDIEVNVKNAETKINIGGYVGKATYSSGITYLLNGKAQGSIKASGTNVNIGGFAGLILGGGIIENFESDVEISSTSFYSVGGILGSASGATLKSCYASEIPAVSGGKYLGLYAGELAGGENLFANVIGTIKGAQFVGSIAGRLFGGTLENSYATSTNVAGDNAGGLVGTLNGLAKISKSFASNTVSATSTAGGLIGTTNNADETIIVNSFSSSTLLGSDVGGLVGNRTSGKIETSYFAGKIVKSENAHLIAGGIAATNTFTNVFVLEEISAGFDISGGASLKSFADFENFAFTNSAVWESGANHMPYIKSTVAEFNSAQTNNKQITATTVSDLSSLNNSNNLFILGTNITSLSTSVSNFSGVLIGGGKKIVSSVPVFENCENALISNINVENNALAKNATNTVMHKIYTTGSATVATDSFGGIAYNATGGIIVLSYSSLNINAATFGKIGGIVGTANNTAIKQSFFSGEIYGVGTAGAAKSAGTIYGFGTANVSNCYSTASIFGNISLTHNLNNTENCYSISFIQGYEDIYSIPQSDPVVRDGEIWSNITGGSAFPSLVGFSSGQEKGTRVNPFEITTAKALADINGTNAYIITSDIVLNSSSVPSKIFEAINTFSGTLYGRCYEKVTGGTDTYTIYNMAMNTSSAKENGDNLNAGMFNSLNNALIAGVKFVNPNIAVGQVENAGLIAGSATGRTVLIGNIVSGGTLFAAAQVNGGTFKAENYVGTKTASVLEFNLEPVSNFLVIKASSVNADSSGEELPPEVKVDSEIETIKINSAEDFVKYFRNANSDRNFELTGNIDLSGYKWFAIIIEFTGTFNGNGFRITGLQDALVVANSGTIENVYIYNSNISSSLGYVSSGLVAHGNTADGIIKNCFAFGVLGSGNARGSIVGSNYGLVENCFGAIYVQENGVGTSEIGNYSSGS